MLADGRDRTSESRVSEEAVKLRDLIQSLASTMVVTGQFLDESTVDLQNLYAHSGSAALAALTPPRFALDEVTVDLCFVVEEAKVASAEGRSPTAPTPLETLTEPDEKTLLDRLSQLRKYESDLVVHEQRLADFRGEQRELQSAERALVGRISKLASTQRATLHEIIGSLGKAPSTISLVKDLRARLGGGIAEYKRRLESDDGYRQTAEIVYATVRQEFYGELKELLGLKDNELVDILMTGSRGQCRILGLILEGFGKPVPEITAEAEELESRLDDVLERLGAEAPARPGKPRYVVAELDRAPSKVPDYGQLWRQFRNNYESLKDSYRQAVERFEKGQGLPRIERRDGLSDELRAAMATAGVAQKTLTAVDMMQKDFAETSGALGELTALIAELKGAGIRVRVDPKSISEADEASRQKIRLTFRTENQETVKVEGAEVGVVR